MSDTQANNSKQAASIIGSIFKFLANYFIAFFDKINNYIIRAGAIHYYHKKYILGNLSHNSKAYQLYQEAILKNKIGEKRFHKLLKIYNAYLRKKDNPDFISKETLAALFFTPEDYVVYTKADYQKQIDHIKRDYQKKFKQDLEQKQQEFKASLIKKILPFTDSGQEGEPLSDYLKHKDMQGIKYYAQRKKKEEIEERERKINLREDQLNIREEKLEVQHERVGLQSDKLDIQKEKLSLQELVFDNERKLFAIEMQTRDLEHKIKMSELLDLSLDLKQKTYKIERFQKEFEIMQGLHDLEIKSREQLLTHGHKMLELKEQGLENEMSLQEAEFIRQQNKNNMLVLGIEGKLLGLRENAFTQKSNEMLLNIKEQFFSLKKEQFEMDLKEQDMDNRLHEQRMRILNERAALDMRQIHMEKERERALFKLHNAELSNHQLKIQNSRLIQDLKRAPKL